MMPSTVADLFENLQTRLDEHEVVSGALTHHAGITSKALGVLDQRVAEALTGLLDIDLGNLALDGWSKYDELLAAAHRSQEAPRKDEAVQLIELRVISTHRPAVELYVAGALVATITFDLEVHIGVHAVDAIVRAGRLVALRGGDVALAARLSAKGQTIVEGATSCPVGVLVPLNDGIPLLEGPRRVQRRDENHIGPWSAALVAGLLIVAFGAGGLLSRTLVLPAPAWPWEQAGIAGVVDPDTAWNMRTAPSRSAKAIGVVQPGQRVRVECLERGWAKLLVPQSGVFVDRRGLRLDAAPPDCSP
jgi:hypothetical protein